MKKSFYTIGSVVILVLVAIAFVLPSTLGSSMGGSAVTFGSYDGKQISYEQGSDFANAVSYLSDMYSQQGIQVDTNNYYYIFYQAFNQVVQQMVATNAVEKSGWTVPVSAVGRAMQPYFYDEDGKFSASLYNQADQACVVELQEQIAKSLVVSRYSDDMFGSSETFGNAALFGLKKSTAENTFIENMGQKERAFDIAVFEMANYPDSEVVEFAKANAEKFVTFDMSVITTEKKSQAQKILREIKKGEKTFEEAASASDAKPYSDTNGKLNQNYFYQLEKIISDKKEFEAVQTLNVGETSGVVKTDGRYSIFRMDSEKKDADLVLDETVRDVRSFLTSYEAGHIEEYYMAGAQKFAADAKNGFRTAINQYKNEYGAKLVETVGFPLNYANVSVIPPVSAGDGIASADKNEKFLETAFSLKDGDVSEPLVIGEAIIVMRLQKENTVDRASANSNDDENLYTGDSLSNDLKSYDSTSAQNVINSSGKLKDNFTNAFFKMMY